MQTAQQFRAFDEEERTMKEALEVMSAGIRNTTVDACANVAEIHFKRSMHADGTGYHYDNGYNQAVRDIAAEIRKLKVSPVPRERK